jgi:hypothetical protein
MKPMPKNLYDLLPIFAVFYNNINQSEPFLENENAEIRIFKPQILPFSTYFKISILSN